MKRDPEKTARNKKIAEISARLKELLPRVLKLTGAYSEQSLNAKIGGKNAEFIDIKHVVVNAPDHFVSLWLDGLMVWLESAKPFAEQSANYELCRWIQEIPEFQEYCFLFLERLYLRNYEALSKPRPQVEDAVMWIGQERASYGLLVTPRFVKGQWENDKSEIRHFPKRYWSIGHVLETGLVVPGKDARIRFPELEDFLTFYEHTLIRASGSPHEAAIASRYCEYVRGEARPEEIALLIPEFRYDGLLAKHKYRLDLCVIDASTMKKVGFEFSPWSTHGELTGTKGKTQKQINEEAKGNFEKEMAKVKDYFRKHEITILVYTDKDLEDPDAIFSEIKRYLRPKRFAAQLRLHTVAEFMKYKL